MTDMTAEQALEMLADMAHMEAEEYARAGGGSRVESLQAIIRQALTAPMVPAGYDWVSRSKGYEDGVNEMAYELKQLCKDFSDLRDRPYMGDVLAQIDAVSARCLEEIPSAHKAAAPTPAEQSVPEGACPHCLPMVGEELARRCAAAPSRPVAPRVPDSSVTEALAQALRECITHFVMIDREESATVKSAEKALAMLTAAPALADATLIDEGTMRQVPDSDEIAKLRERVKVLELTAGYASHDIDNIALLLRGEEDLQKLCRGIAERLRLGEGR